ncbi:MAG: hypothetical protein CME65_12470 [Halobacteriovoraceae bacterium]|nr:hypothetical protein [Halobacteriovoraceae bacterium]|tara:strand:- start:6083 stop:7027 length:945 start_codon:yes stop_codon:yes gene_type:complete
METAKQNLYSIQFVSNVTGINPHTIRAWEKRYGATKPVRDKNGRRLYSDGEIHRLDLLNKLVGYGNNISDIAYMDISELTEVFEKYGGKKNDHQQADINIDIESALSSIYLGVKFFKLDVMNHELTKAAEALSSIEFAMKIVKPLIQEIRKLKGEGVLSPDQREQIYLIIKSQLIKKIYLFKNSANNKKKILICSPQGRLNELGAMAATILFLDLNYEVEFLGGNVKPEILGELSKQFKADYIFVGLNYSHESSMSLTEKQRYLEILGENFFENTKVLIGAHDYCFSVPHPNMECFDNFDAMVNRVEGTQLAVV